MRNNHEIKVDTEKCIGCKLCMQDCPVGNIEIINKAASIKGTKCIMCGHCVAICPNNAVEITGFEDPSEPIGDNDKLEANDLMRAIKARRSIRHFSNKAVEREMLDLIIEAGRYTPTGANTQNVSYALITQNIKSVEEKAVSFLCPLKKVGGVFNSTLHSFDIDDNFFFKGASAVIAIVSPSKVDGALAASNMELMAQAQGLGVLYSGLFTLTANLSHRVRKALGLKAGEKVVTALVIGYPDVRYFRTAQKERPLIRKI